jgi:hypothetical protein
MDIKTGFYAGITPEGELRIGNDPTCVLFKQRPPLPSGLSHALDLGEDDLLTISDIAREELAKLGIEVSNITFIPKDSMTRLPLKDDNEV